MAIRTVNITELANIERSSGKVYPAGCTLIQVSATRGQVLYHAEEAEIPSHYAVFFPNDKAFHLYYPDRDEYPDGYPKRDETENSYRLG